MSSYSYLTEKMVDLCVQTGFCASDVAFLQPIDPFLELSGEDLRSRLWTTQDAEGQEFCLRPEFTIPAALAYLQEGEIGRRVDQFFVGFVFRQISDFSSSFAARNKNKSDEIHEFTQLGIESFGRRDIEAADADLFAQVFACIQTAYDEDVYPTVQLRMGDIGLLQAFFAALKLDALTARRLILALHEGRIGAFLAPSTRINPSETANGLARYSAMLEALKGAAPAEAQAFVADLLALAGMKTMGSRSAEAIAQRFLERAHNSNQFLSVEQASLIQRFLALEGDPDSFVRSVRSLTREANLDITEALERFETRIGFIEARGLPLQDIQTLALFSRNMDYYSGFVFDIRGRANNRVLAAGGRYDRLFQRLGHSVHGIGAAIWVDRVEGERKAIVSQQVEGE